MDTLFEFAYYLGFVACLSSLNNGTPNQSSDIGYISGDTTTHVMDTTKNDSLKKAPLLLGAQQAKRLSECDTIVIYRED